MFIFCLLESLLSQITMKKNLLSFLPLFFIAFLMGNQLLSQGCVPRSSFFYGEILPSSGCGVWTTSPTDFGPGEYFRMPVLAGGSYSISTCGNTIDTQITGFQGTTTTTSIFYNDDFGPDCPSSAQASINITPSFTDYTRVNVNEYNCLAGGSSSIFIKVRQNNNLSFTSSAADMCEGESRSLTATPTAVTGSQPGSGDEGSFSGTGVSGTTFTAPSPAADSATYTITYTFGYCSTTQDIKVFKAPGTPDAGPDQQVCDTVATLGATAVAYGAGKWSVISGTGTVATPSDPASVITGLTLGATTTLEWTWTNGPCAGTADTVVLDVNAPPSDPVVSGPASMCVGDTITLVASSGAGTFVYSWYDAPTGGLLLWTGDSYTINPSSDVTVYVEVQDTSTTCQSNRTSHSVTVNPLPVVDLGTDDAICDGDTACLDAGNPGATYLWSTSGTGQVECVTMAGTYSVTVTDSNSCENSDAIVIGINPLPVVNLGADTTLCDGASLTLDGTDPTAFTYDWSTGDTTASIVVSAAGTYILTLTDTLTCVGMDTVVVGTAATPAAAFSVDTSGCPIVNFSDMTTGSPDAWSWDFGDGSGTSTSSSPSYDYSTAGNGSYTVTLVASNGCGIDTTTTTVDIGCIVGIVDSDLKDHLRIYPNPNAGAFFVEFTGVNAEDVRIELFDLKGQRVYAAEVDVNGDLKHKVDVTNKVAGGMYMIKVTTRDTQSTDRVIIH